MARAASVTATLSAPSLTAAWDGVQAAWASIPEVSRFVLAAPGFGYDRDAVQAQFMQDGLSQGLLEVAPGALPGSFDVILRLAQEAIGITLEDPNTDAWQEAWRANRPLQAQGAQSEQLQNEMVNAAQEQMNKITTAIDRWEANVGTQWIQSLVVAAAVVIQQKSASGQQMGSTVAPPPKPQRTVD